ncbi:MAG: hypothetical protein J4451_01120 [DPANN group archaeon]|nr:hypothetical protein [DPANN group archaeon]
MFKWYGLIGILMVGFAEANFFFKIQPLANWYFPIIWFGYILVLDAVIYKLKGNSLISNRFEQFLGMVILSALFWWIFEFINIPVHNWSYSNVDFLETGVKAAVSNAGNLKNIFGTIAFSTVLPAFFETAELIRSLHIFDKFKLPKKYKISKKLLISMVIFGIICFVAPIFLPTFAFPLVWMSFFFILDPINYLHKQPSIIKHLEDRNLVIPLSLLLAGIVMGFFWEFWNYWAITKWTYSLPFVNFFKIFEMPILGYLGYFPFAFELYAMYWFVRSLFIKKEKLLAI